MLDIEDRDLSLKKSSLDSMPFPPGVGGSRVSGEANANSQSYEVITTDKAIDESNVGNRMLRSMGWHEGVVVCLLFVCLVVFFLGGGGSNDLVFIHPFLL